MSRLRADDLRRFAREGYLVVPDVVPEPLLAAADAEIDAVTGELDPVEGDRGAGVTAWFPSVARVPCCDDVLRRSPALAIARELVAPHPLDHAFDHIQISTTRPPWPHIPAGPHVDGHRRSHPRPASFTLLAGVLLTDQRGDQSGNLWVWPGSHLDHQELCRRQGPAVLQMTDGHSTLLPSPPILPAPEPVRGRRGDLVLAHFLLGHNKGGNTAPHVRRTLYYRLAVPGHAERWPSTFLDAWTEYEPIRSLLEA